MQGDRRLFARSRYSWGLPVSSLWPSLSRANVLPVPLVSLRHRARRSGCPRDERYCPSRDQRSPRSHIPDQDPSRQVLVTNLINHQPIETTPRRPPALATAPHAGSPGCPFNHVRPQSSIQNFPSQSTPEMSGNQRTGVEWPHSTSQPARRAHHQQVGPRSYI